MSDSFDGVTLEVPKNEAVGLLLYDPSRSIADLEKEYIDLSMEYFGGNKTKAALALGVTVKTLYNKLHEYDLFDKYQKIGKRSEQL